MWIDLELQKGLTPPKIVQRAAKALFHSSNGGQDSVPNDRDHFISLVDVHNVKMNIDREKWRHDDDDVKSVHMWALSNPSLVLLYEPPTTHPYHPLRIIIQTPLQLKWMQKIWEWSLPRHGWHFWGPQIQGKCCSLSLQIK